MSVTEPEKRLFYFPLERMQDAFRKGNVEIVQHYESYFDRIDLVYFYGHTEQPVERGRVTWRSVGTRMHALDVILAPWRMYRVARERKPTHYLTSDLVFSWWTSLLLRLFCGARVVVMPIALPEDIYANTRRSLTGIPMWLERMFIRQSFRASWKVIVSKKNQASIAWLRSQPSSARKLQIVDVIPEQFPPPRLLDSLLQKVKIGAPLRDPVRLLYVGRMHWQKLSFELIDMMRALADRGVKARLVMAGDGPDLAKMREHAAALGVGGDIEWLGFVDETKLADIYPQSDIFISTVTGTALREAGFCGLPVVGYDVRFFDGLLEHEGNALLVPVHDSIALAREVERAIGDPALRERIAANLHSTICAGWDRNYIPVSLKAAFER